VSRKSSYNQPHILHASSNLLGICFVLITGLKLTNNTDHTLSDEFSIVAALGFIISCILSFISMRVESIKFNYELIADYIFLISMITLFIAVFIFARGIL
jgi:hypothetical protein